MTLPSVKGTIFRTVADELNGYLSQGVISRADLGTRCKPDDLEFLDREILIASWYPIDTYGRYLRFLCDHFGGGQREYLVKGGRHSAQRVIEMGVYGQLDERTARWETKVGRVLVTLGGSFYNFGRWVWKGTESHAVYIEFHDAAPMPEEAAARAQGFIQHLATRAANRPMRLVYERPKPSLILFRADRPG